jgi:hypothetical protein
VKNDIVMKSLAQIALTGWPAQSDGPLIHSADRTAASRYGRLTQIKAVIRVPPKRPSQRRRHAKA